MSEPAHVRRPDRNITDGAAHHVTLSALVRQPWMLRVGRNNVLIRGASTKDLRAFAGMHARCSPRTLLDRYRTGGRSPAVLAMEQMLRRPLSFVACTATGEMVAMATATADLRHDDGSAEIGVLVEDAWQSLGVGRELMTHLAAGALVCGYRELIAYPATSVVPAQRLLIDVGHTRVVLYPRDQHLHTFLPESAALGLGAVRERLAS